MKKILIAIILFVCATDLMAQKKFSFSSQNYVGLLAGGSETNAQVQTINGITKDKWFYGLGAGIDWYYFRSVPLFLTAERSFRIKPKKNLFLSASAGANLPWVNNDDRYYADLRIRWTGDINYYGGFYWNTGFGYKINVGKHSDAILFHMGFSNKFMKTINTFSYPCLIGPCPVEKETFKYNLRSISLKLGYGF